MNETRIVFSQWSPAVLEERLSISSDCVLEQDLDVASRDGQRLQRGDRIVRIADEAVFDRAQVRGIIRSIAAKGGVQIEVQRVASVPVCSSFSAGFEALGASGVPPSTTGMGYALMLPSKLKVDDGADLSPSASSVTQEDPLDTGLHFRRKVASEIDRVAPGCCIVGICDNAVNPTEQLQILAAERGIARLVVVDCSDKIKRLPTLDAFAEMFREAMTTGWWFFISKASRAMSHLTLLSDLILEIRHNGLRGLHSAARVIISSEPHPHFPMALLLGGITLRVSPADSIASLVLTSLSDSSSIRRLALGTPTDCHSSPTVRVERRVKINTFIDVVNIEPREALRSVASPEIPFEPSSSSSPALILIGYFKGLSNERFYSMNVAGIASPRYVVSSASGNVYILDGQGVSLASFHAQDSAVWDVSFDPAALSNSNSNSLSMVTGGEDGLGVWWSRDETHPDSLVCRDVVRLANDVYAVKHTNSGRAVGLGGYLPHVLVRGRLIAAGAEEAPQQHEVLMTTAVQGMAAVEGSELLLCGGSDGTVTAVDAEAGTVLWSVQRHAKKCPCLSTTGPHTVVSGAYEGTVKVWDVRAAADSKCEVIKFREAVTGVAVSGDYMAACVAEGLHLWDRRRLREPLGSVSGAWEGLCRGIVLDSGRRVIVTGSTDGFARFWSFSSADPSPVPGGSPQTEAPNTPTAPSISLQGNSSTPY